MTSAIDSSFITTAPVDKAPFKLALDTAASEITALQNGKVAKAGDTMTGDLTVSKVNPGIILQKAASGQPNYIGGTTAGSYRWSIELGNSATESGSNAGSNFQINRFNDAGTYVDAPLAIARATGAPTFANAALWRSALVTPALPTAVAGVAGEFVGINPGLGNAAVIPANGVWAAFGLRYGDGTSWPFGTYDGNIFTGVFAGGTLVGTALSDRFWLGFCWRIS